MESYITFLLRLCNKSDNFLCNQLNSTQIPCRTQMGGISNDNLIFCPLWASAGSSGDSVSFKSQSSETVNWLAITLSVCAKQPARVYSHIFVASAAAFVRQKTHLKPAQLCFSFISLIKQWMLILKSAREQELRQLFFSALYDELSILFVRASQSEGKRLRH